MAPPATRERRWWNSAEDRILQEATNAQEQQHGSVKDWNVVCANLPGRTNKDCRKRWDKIRQEIRKGPWTPEEDRILRDAVSRFGPRWSTVATKLQTRNADQCSKRWQHVLNPERTRAPWTPEEDAILREAVAIYGRDWKLVCSLKLPDRSAHDVRNRSVALERRTQRRIDSSAGDLQYHSADEPTSGRADEDYDDEDWSEAGGDWTQGSTSLPPLLPSDPTAIADLNISTSETLTDDHMELQSTANEFWHDLPAGIDTQLPDIEPMFSNVDPQLFEVNTRSSSGEGAEWHNVTPSQQAEASHHWTQSDQRHADIPHTSLVPDATEGLNQSWDELLRPTPWDDGFEFACSSTNQQQLFSGGFTAGSHGQCLESQPRTLGAKRAVTVVIPRRDSQLMQQVLGSLAHLDADLTIQLMRD